MSSLKDLDLSKLPADFAAWYSAHLEKVASARATVETIVGSPMPSIRARLIRSTRLGAEALKGWGGYEIRLSAALPAILHFTFNSLLRTPEYMYGIGDADAEQRHRDKSERIPLALPRGVEIEQAIVAITTLSRPRDPQRAATAVLLSELAMVFSAYHELAHVLLGHVDASRRLSGRSRLLEMAESSPASQKHVAGIRFVWEYEADMLATNMLLQDMVDPAAEGPFRETYGKGADTGALSRLQAMLGAVLVVFLLIAQVTPRRRRSHPEPLVRFAAIANDAGGALLEQHPQLGLDFEEVGEAINDVALSTLSAWKALGLGTSRASPLRNLMTAEREVEKLERDRLAGHGIHSSAAWFYPFRS